MWRSKKVIIIAVLAAVVLVGSISGVALAQTGDEDNSRHGAKYEALMDKVCAIYEENTGTAIDAQELQEAFSQARSEMRDEALDEYLQGLVDEGQITQEEADQYKAWLEARPDIPAIAGSPVESGLPGDGMYGGPGGHGGGFPGGGGTQPTESAE
jgi:hypothetical protein